MKLYTYRVDIWVIRGPEPEMPESTVYVECPDIATARTLGKQIGKMIRTFSKYPKGARQQRNVSRYSG